MGYENVGRVWTPNSLKEYLGTINKPSWCKAVTLHHTGAPSLAQRKDGLRREHIDNICHYYKNKMRWSAGPHLFTDEDQIWGMSDLRKQGVHAVSFNSMSIGIEVLGDYNTEDPGSGRGLACWQTTAAATKVLLDWLGLKANERTVLFHRDDPKTTKTCPGSKVKKEWVLKLINEATIEPKPGITQTSKPAIGVTLKSNEWNYVGERWCIPVRAFLLKKNVPEAEISAKLKRDGKNFYFGAELLEGAYYDKASSTTWAPVRELIDLV